MALHKDFPNSPHAILDPEIRWFPADEAMRETTMDKLIPPLVAQLRKKVKEFRDSGYVGATDTSTSLLSWWFKEPHLLPQSDGTMSEFQYFFAQREALETIIYLYDVVGAKDKFDLMRFDSSGAVSAQMFDETWRRYVIKMATGSGKTKVMSLALAWSFFHKLYEPDSELSRNFLVIAPNIIVLDRIYKDFQGLRIFFEDPVLPDNGFEGRNWRDDFQLTLHKQDEVNVTHPTGNIFLTNIHRVYAGEDIPPSPDDDNTMDYFLGNRPTGATTDSKVDLGMIVRDIDELMVLNDEAHHIHDAKLAWFQSIQDIHNRLLQKGDALSLQLDVTATPKHNNGAIFVQTVADYPLVEAISQNVVKHPVLPDAASRAKLSERQSAKYTEKYADYLDLGVIEWRKAYEEHQKLGKKAILFVMTDDTKNCDDVAVYLEGRYPELKGGVLVIHTKNNGEISEAASGKAKEELEKLRKQSNEIDDAASPYKVIVSVLMLKEGWDVRNVTTIVGLRAYSAKSNILPEQTLGRGLRKMYPGGIEEYVSVVGTDAFMDFVESIQAEGVELERKAMGEGTKPKTPLVIEVDNENVKKDIDKLDIEIPVLTPRVYREYKNLDDLDAGTMVFQPVIYQQFSEEEQREIVFEDITTGEVTHTTILDTAGVADYRSVVGYFAQTVMKELRLVSGYDVLYGKIKSFIQTSLFSQYVDLESPNTLRNLSELAATKTIIETFKKAINDLTVRDKGDAEIRDTIKLRQTRPFVVKDQGYLMAKKSVFNRVIGDSHLELLFARFLEDCDDIISYAKNYLAVHFKLDYVNADGDISNYYPDFIVKKTNKEVYIVETKGQEDLDVPLKTERLKQWCQDINHIQSSVRYDFIYVDEENFEKYQPSSFSQLADTFRAYKEENKKNIDLFSKEVPSKALLHSLKLVSLESDFDHAAVEDEAESQEKLLEDPLNVPVWFGTNRTIIATNGVVEGFGGEWSSQTTLGRCVVNIPKGHVPGSLGSSWWVRLIKGDNRLKILSIDSIPDGDYWDGIGKEMSSENEGKRKGETLFFLHGYNVTFSQAALRTAQIAYDLRIHPAVFFSWPSGGDVDDYLADEASIEASYDAVTGFVSRLDMCALANGSVLHVIAHSMGNRALLKALEAIASGMSGGEISSIDKLVFAAPDVDARVFMQSLNKITKLGNSKTLYTSQKDKAIWLSKSMHKYPRAGLMPPVTVIKGLDTIDATDVDKTFVGHSYIASVRALISDLSSLLKAGLPPSQRVGLDVAGIADGIKYWQIK